MVTVGWLVVALSGLLMVITALGAGGHWMINSAPQDYLGLALVTIATGMAGGIGLSLFYRGMRNWERHYQESSDVNSDTANR